MADNHPVDLGIDGLQQAQEIGAGGFATVFRAYQPAFRRTVAVKVLATPNLDRAARERFERECQAMGTLTDHPHIVTIYGSGYTRQGRPYLVMAYLPGGSLQDRLDTHGPLPWEESTLYAVHLAGALETAHRAGIVHRDIKPGNVLLSPYGEAQLTDFGIARISGGHETRSGLITASMAHAPPEVLDGHRPTVAADVYALGSTMFELMYGRPAFASPADESMVPMLRRILTDAPPDLRGRGVPDVVCRAIEWAMAKTPDLRPASAADLGRELQGARRALGLDPGRLTVPSDIAGGRPVSYVVVPAPPGPSAPPPGRPGGAPAVPGSPGSAPRPDGSAGRAPAAALASADSGRRPPPPDSGRRHAPVGRGPERPRPARPSFDAPPSRPPRSGGSRPVVVGLLAVLMVAAALGAFALRRDPSGTQTTATTRNVLGDRRGSATTRARAGAGYDEQVAREFSDGCINEASNTPDFCTCLYDAIVARIPYADYEKLNQAVDRGRRIEETPVWDLATDCWKKHPVPPR
jgi:serine/threonine protein kinase